MSKQKLVYVCRECGFDSPKWLGRCPGCEAWNSLEPLKESKMSSRVEGTTVQKPLLISDFNNSGELRKLTGIGELDRVLGGGLVDGSLVLIGGDPGIGKSTLLLAAAAQFSRQHGDVLYISGEESASQTGLRARRTGSVGNRLWVLAEPNLESVLQETLKMKPTLLIIDSIQTVYCPDTPGTSGSVSQIRESTARLLRLAKEQSMPVIIVGHVTKDGSIAGPRLLEHMVDTVLYFEGERNYSFRVLRPIKNRFGSIAESGIFSMESEGLTEVRNPSQYLLAQRMAQVAGTAVAACIEGTRPLLIEIQALVSTTCFGLPRRAAAGFDSNRLGLLLAVLEKREGLMLGNQDVYVNAVGGFRVSEPAADLAVMLSVASNFKDRVVPGTMVAVGEVGLTGEVRPVPHILQRVREIENLGFAQAMVPRGNMTELKKLSWKIKLIEVASVNQALKEGLR